MRAAWIYLITFFLEFHAVFPQASLKDSSITTPFIHFGASINFPNGHWKKNYNLIPEIPLEVGIKTRKNFTLTAGFNYLFVDRIKTRAQLFQHIDTFDGMLIDKNGELVFPDVTAQGYSFLLKAGKTFPNLIFKSPNLNTGFFFELGIRLTRHKYNIQVPKTLPIMQGEYLKGYDHLTLALGPDLTVGYRFFSNKRLVNFTIFLEHATLFARNLRGYNYDEQAPDTQTHIDFLHGIKVLWCLPLYRRAPQDFYYY